MKEVEEKVTDRTLEKEDISQPSGIVESTPLSEEKRSADHVQDDAKKSGEKSLKIQFS